MEIEFVTISTRVTKIMRNGLDKLAKEHDITRSEMLRTLIAEVVDDSEGVETRSYKRRKHEQKTDD